ncbi:MAG: caspase family protein [Rhizobiaceae bacterium]|nr:caspase family protein [Rhizobiaceae bacterium]
MHFGIMSVAALVLCGTFLTATVADARTNRAVLVAVTKYPNVPGADLVGPNNDARLVHEYLTTNELARFAPENVTVLADGVEGAAASPTYQAITDALAEVAAKSESGDFVYLHMSGHGFQQPAADLAAEPDGKDEIFLPADIRSWENIEDGVPSALPDDEIGKAIQAIRDKGAFVWVVIDACHSGTATRALGASDVTDRSIDAGQLGIPQNAYAEALAQGGASRSVGTEENRALLLYATQTTSDMDSATAAEPVVPGGMVAFFAAQTVETTPEMLLPRGDENARKLGLFTYTLFSKMAENPGQSYRQLGASIMQAYAADNRTRPTPLFEGNLDAPVFGTEVPENALQQWRVSATDGRVTIPAGRLHRLAPGTKLALLASPADLTEDAFGYVEVVSADNMTSRVRSVEHEGRPRVTPDKIPDGSYARLAELTFEIEMTVARPTPNPDHADEIAQTNALLETIASGDDIPVKIRLVAPDETADLRVEVMSEQDVALLQLRGAGQTGVSKRAAISDAPRLWFLSPSAEISLDEGRRPPSIGFAGSTPEGLQSEVGESLTTIFRAVNLARLAAANTFNPQAFDVQFNIKRLDVEDREALRADKTPRVHPDDQVHLLASNSSGKPVDINVLYIGSDYSITHIVSERMHTGDSIDWPLLAFNKDSYGIERMVVALSEADAITPVEDLSFLAQQGVRTMTRSLGHPDGFSGLLRDIGVAPATTRNITLLRRQGSTEKNGALLIYSLETMPRG